MTEEQTTQVIESLISGMQILTDAVLTLQEENKQMYVQLNELRLWCDHTGKITEENNTIFTQEIKKLRERV